MPPPPPPLRPSSMVSVELKPCSTTSVEYFSTPLLVGPFAGLQRALDVNLGALLQILLGDLAEAFGEDHHPMPLGLFLALAGRLVAPGIGCRHAQIGDRPPILRPPDLGIACRDCRPESPCSRFPPSPLSTLKTTGLNPTLYAPRSRQPGDPRLSTYSIPGEMFQFCSRQNPPDRSFRAERYLGKTRPIACPESAVPTVPEKPNKSLVFQNSHFVRECCISETAFPLGSGILRI